MHRAARIGLVGGVLFAVAACGTANSPVTQVPATAAGAAPATAGAAPAQGETKAACEAIGQVYSTNMGPFAKALTDMVAGRQDSAVANRSQQQAQQSLKAFATAISAATQTSTDPQLRTDGKQTADRMLAKSADAGFFRKIQTNNDVNTVLSSTLKEWLSPVSHHCS